MSIWLVTTPEELYRDRSEYVFPWTVNVSGLLISSATDRATLREGEAAVVEARDSFPSEAEDTESAAGSRADDIDVGTCTSRTGTRKPRAKAAPGNCSDTLKEIKMEMRGREPNIITRTTYFFSFIS